MRFLLSFILVLCALTVRAATPSFTSFLGSNGVTVLTNPTTGKIVITGTSGAATNAQPPSSILTNLATVGISTTNVMWVSKAGNDATAARNRLDLPAQTLDKAVKTAIPGDTVWVLPGTYNNCSNLWRTSGINFHLVDAVLQWTNTAGVAAGMFDDRFSNMAVTSNVSGSGRFLWCTGLPTVDDGVWTYVNANALGFHVQTNPLSRTVIKGTRLDYVAFAEIVGDPSGSFVKAGTNILEFADGYYDVYYRSNYTNYDATLAEMASLPSSASGIYWELGDMHVKMGNINAKTYTIYPRDPGSGVGNHNLYLDIDNIEGKYYAFGGTNYNWRVWTTFRELNNTNSGSSGVAIDLYGAGRHYFTGQKVLGFGDSVLAHSSGAPESWFTIQKVSGLNNWVSITGGETWMDIQHFEDLGTVLNGFSLSGGTNFFRGMEATVTNTAGRVVQHTGGRSKFIGLTMSTSGNTNCVVLSRTNNLTLQGCTLIGSTSQFALSTDVNATNHVRILGCFGTSDMTNKLTNAVGPYTISTFVQ